MLAAYSARLPAVELNNTFYRRPDPEAVARWRRLTPPDFRFCPKAQKSVSWRVWTPDAVGEAMTWLSDDVQPFGEQLGCVLLAAPGTRQRDDAALARLLEARPAGLPMAISLPHPSWADDEVHARLAAHDVALVAMMMAMMLDPRALPSSTRAATVAATSRPIHRWACRS